MKEVLAGIAAALGLIAYVGVAGGLVDLLVPPTEREVELVAAHIQLSHPCGATISQGMTSVTMQPARCVRVKVESR